ncbi:MAG: hypothetical protein LUC93_07255 [Planctomycetaceae bacterium]|nr:hypothetical protein [Planctomycetaceae bacterium]
MPERFILAIDQGTSATKCVLIDKKGRIVARGSSPLGESYPAPGWVDQDPEAIWASVGLAAKACLDGRDPGCIEAVALSTQRESMLLWDRATGKPISSLVSWQDRRSVDACEALRRLGHADLVRERSGLPLDPMFSALKAKWLLDEYDPDREKSRRGDVCLGTIDSFFLSRFAGDDHLTEAGNASRTQLLNVRSAEWDADLLDVFDIPAQALPRVCKSNGPFPALRGVAGLPDGIPTLAVLGDSHAALFGHGLFTSGGVKATYGTGSSVMGLTGGIDRLHPGICLTIAWQVEDKPSLAAETNIRSSGATLKWAGNLLGIDAGEVAELARVHHLSGSEGAVVVPGFNGLGGPWWDNAATGLIDCLGLDSGRGAVCLGALESIPNQIADVIELLRASGMAVDILSADGGPTRNGFLMQLQADYADVRVHRSPDAELSALGAAHLAGLSLGWWTWNELAERERPGEKYLPTLGRDERDAKRNRWKESLAKARSRTA